MLIWRFSTQDYVYGDLYKNRVNVSGNAEQSDASITIGQLTMDDNGTYECSVSLLTDLEVTSKARVRLLVLGECPHLLPGGRKQVRQEGSEDKSWGRTEPDAAVPDRTYDSSVIPPSRAGLRLPGAAVLSSPGEGSSSGQRAGPIWV